MMKKVKNQNQTQNNSEVFQKAQSYSLRLLSIRLRTEKEIRDKLFQKDYPPDVIDIVLQKLTTSNLINDVRFAQLWFESRKNLKNKSNFFIEMELKQKGISDEIINQISKEPKESSDLNSAKKLLERKKHLFDKKIGREKLQKQQQYLMRNGYSWETVKNVTTED